MHARHTLYHRAASPAPCKPHHMGFYCFCSILSNPYCPSDNVFCSSVFLHILSHVSDSQELPWALWWMAHRPKAEPWPMFPDLSTSSSSHLPVHYCAYFLSYRKYITGFISYADRLILCNYIGVYSLLLISIFLPMSECSFSMELECISEPASSPIPPA